MKKLVRGGPASAIVSGVLSITALLIFYPYHSKEIPASFLIGILLFFFTGWLLIFFFADKVIYWRIFLAIHHYREKQTVKTMDSITFMKDGSRIVEQELDAWADDRKAELEKMRKLELYRKEYLGNVSHELKTPVFNIQGYILTLLDGALEDQHVNRDYLARAEKSVERMINMIEDLESISQLETGELTLETEKFDIIALVKEVFHSQELMATAKGILFNIKDNPDRTVCVMADRSRIRQVLTNLIVNSVKYGKEYGRTEIAIYEQENIIYVEVRDDGIGIKPEHLPRLFERFYRVDKSRSREQGGTGLGLSIVKHIIEAHAQEISVTSTPGEGSTFVFTLKKC
ncbi:MAG TPA: ATP-binding protein [Bacteroidia bacterium]|jgi:two-component system phosphate regulon sensor histidine kinase PhoR